MESSVQKFIYKIKGYANSRELLIAVLIILVGLGSFGLGRLSKVEELKEPVRIEYGGNTAQVPPQSMAAVASISENQKLFVASKNGTKYHHPWCPGALQISEQNKIWFASQEEAEKAGYTAASNCKGL